VGIRRFAAPTLLALAVAGCSSAKQGDSANAGSQPPGAGSPSAAPSDSAQAAAAYDVNKVCALLTPDEIKAATGAAVVAGEIADRQAGLWAECRYAYASDSLSIVRVQLATPTDSAGFFDAAKQDVTTSPMTVPGADEARWNSAFGTVYVTKAGVAFFVQIEDDHAIDRSKTEALTVKALANVGRLT
jgi:hypothetical protein